MAIRQATNVKFDGTIWTAFQMFCARKGIETTCEGLRALVREAPEFKRLENALIQEQIGMPEMTELEVIKNGEPQEIDNGH